MSTIIGSNGIVDGQIVYAEHVLRIIHALSAVTQSAILLNGELYSTGSNTFYGTSSFYGDSVQISSSLFLLPSSVNINNSASRILAIDSSTGIVYYRDVSSITGSGVINTGSFSGSFSGSFFGDGSALTGIISSKWTGSGDISRFGNVRITGSLLVSGGNLDFQNTKATGSILKLIGLGTTSGITFEVDDNLSSAKFKILDSGAVIITNSVTGSIFSASSFTGSFFGTSSNSISSSYSDTSVSSSFSQTARSSSYAITSSVSINSNTASFVQLAQSASYVQTAQTASISISSSFSETARSSSYAITSSNANTSSISISSSFSQTARSSSYSDTARSSSYSDTARSSSYAITASFVGLAQSASYVLLAQSASVGPFWNVSGTTNIISQVNITPVSASYLIFDGIYTSSAMIQNHISISGSIMGNSVTGSRFAILNLVPSFSFMTSQGSASGLDINSWFDLSSGSTGNTAYGLRVRSTGINISAGSTHSIFSAEDVLGSSFIKLQQSRLFVGTNGGIINISAGQSNISDPGGNHQMVFNNLRTRLYITNNGVANTSNQAIKLFNDNTFGRVGVGTDNDPDARFQVAGISSASSDAAQRWANIGNIELGRFTNNGSLGIGNFSGSIISASFHVNTSGSGQSVMSESVRISMTYYNTSSAQNSPAILLNLVPRISQSLGSASFTGIDYNPNINILTGSHYAALFRVGSVGIGVATPTALTHIRGIGTTTATSLLVEDSSQNARFTIKDNGDVILQNRIRFVTGSTAASLGSSTLVAGVVTVSSSIITGGTVAGSGTKVFLSIDSIGILANVGTLYEDRTMRSPGNSFTIRSSNVLDTSTINWHLIEPST